MNNELLIIAAQLLESLKPNEIETVQIENTKYDDGSTGFSINVTYPAKDIDVTNLVVDGELVSTSCNCSYCEDFGE